ncbi:MAG: response regulator [Candidatus Krumholzibacteriota bacterium]|nr:response regulator [Candidatus Krumholzibacteriota bacterium]
MSTRELILVVDDSSLIRQRMKEILSRNGYDVLLRENGEAGILAALEYYPDMIIMDMNMPKMDGFQASRILKRYPQTKMIPIAVFTDNRGIQQKVSFFEVGVEDFIVKDADEAEIIARVSGLLRWKRNRDKVIREKDKLSYLLDSLSDSVIIIDDTGKLLYFNRMAAQRFNLIPELIQDRTIHDILPETEKVMEMFSLLDKREEFGGFEIEIEREGGKKIYLVDVSRVYIELSEDVGGAVILKDITAEKEAERVKAEFYSMMAHEMRTPISVVLGYTQLILEGKAGKVSKLQKEFLKGVESKGKILMKLVNDFLDVSRLENKLFKLEKEIFDLSPLLTSTVEGIRLLAENKGIELKCVCENEIILLEADRDKLDHVLINLIENAIKYTESGGRVTVLCRRGDGGAEIEIRDTGIGMSAEEIKHIFDRFKRCDKAEKKKIKGTGLGLAIVKEILDAHQARIEVQSKDNEGSTFHLWIPGLVDFDTAEERGFKEVEINVP